MDYAGRQVTLGGRAVALTDMEYRLLCEFAVNAGKTPSRAHMMSQVRPEHGAYLPYGWTVGHDHLPLWIRLPRPLAEPLM